MYSAELAEIIPKIEPQETEQRFARLRQIVSGAAIRLAIGGTTLLAAYGNMNLIDKTAETPQFNVEPAISGPIVPGQSPQVAPAAKGSVAPAPSVEALAQVTEWFDPSYTLLNKMWSGYLVGDLAKHESSDTRLTFHSLDEYYRQVPEYGTGTFDDYMGPTKDFLAQYGVDLELSDMLPPGATTRVSLMEATKKPQAIQSVLSLARAFSMTPAEEIRDDGVKHILLFASKPDYPAVGLAYTYGTNDTIALNLTYGFDETVFFHENGHIKDARELGYDAANNDQPYVNINGGNIYTPNWKHPSELSLDTYTDRLWSSDLKRNADGQNTNLCSTKATLAAERAVVPVVSNYSFDNMVEDKGEMYSRLFGWFDPNLLSPANQKLRAKALLLEARAWQVNPDVVKHYAQNDSRSIYFNQLPCVDASVGAK